MEYDPILTALALVALAGFLEFAFWNRHTMCKADIEGSLLKRFILIFFRRHSVASCLALQVRPADVASPVRSDRGNTLFARMTRVTLSAVVVFSAIGAFLGCADSAGPRRAGAAAKLEIVAGNEQAGTVGAQLHDAIVVRVTDAGGSPVEGQLVNFRVVEGGGSVFGGSSLTNSDGIAREIWTLGNVAGVPQKLEARAVDNDTGAPIIFATFTATVQAGPASQMSKVAGDEQVVIVGQALPVLPAVRVTDRFGNPRAGEIVSFAITGGAGTLTGAQALTGPDGVATVGSWVFDDAGLHTIAATSGTLPPVVFTARTRGIGLDGVAHSGSALCGWQGTRRFCAGISNYGAFGNGTAVNSSALFTEVTSPGGLTFMQLDGGSNAFCGLGSDGVAYCWGSDNQVGEIGDGTTNTPRIAPTRVALPAGTMLKAVSTGSDVGCALTVQGSVYCWGSATGGAIGDGLDSLRPSDGNHNLIQATPSPVALPPGVTFNVISTGGSSCGLDQSGVSYCWGMVAGNDSSQGNAVPTQTRMPSGVQFDSISVGLGFACALARTGDLYCWGANNWGQIGQVTSGSPVLTPTLLPRQAGSLYVAVHVGSSFACALTSTGKVVCWGDNQFGQLGDGMAVVLAEAPRQILTPPGVVFTSLDAGEYSACAHTSRGATFCWGSNSVGQLGNGTTVTNGTPSLADSP